MMYWKDLGIMRKEQAEVFCVLQKLQTLSDAYEKIADIETSTEYYGGKEVTDNFFNSFLETIAFEFAVGVVNIRKLLPDGLMEQYIEQAEKGFVRLVRYSSDDADKGEERSRK